MILELVSEMVIYVFVFNYREDFDISVLFFMVMKRFYEEVDFKLVLWVVCYKDMIVCYKDCIKKCYVSRVFYELKIKFKIFFESMVIYLKCFEWIFVILLDYYIEECRKWFKIILEFKVWIYISSKIMKDSGYGLDLEFFGEEGEGWDR